jgi:hypothetical protein
MNCIRGGKPRIGIPTALPGLSRCRQPWSMADFVLSAPREMGGIVLRALPGVTRPAAEGPLDSPTHERSPASEIGSSSKLFLPRDALLEFAIWCHLGVVVEWALPVSGISNSGGRRAGIRGAGRWRCCLAQMREHLAHGQGTSAMKVIMCLSVPHSYGPPIPASPVSRGPFAGTILGIIQPRCRLPLAKRTHTRS